MSTVYLSTAYFAPVSYYASFLRYDRIVIEQWCNYTKQTYRNRCHIAGANGLLALSVPIVKPDTIKCPTKDIRISDHGEWRHLHWNAIASAYGSSPFFEYYQDDIRPFFEKRYEFLLDFNEEIRRTVCNLIGIEPHIEYSSSYSEPAPGETDLRDGVELTLGVIVQLVIALLIGGHVVLGEFGEIHENLVLNALRKAGGPAHAYVGEHIGQIAGCNGNAELLRVGSGGNLAKLYMNTGELLGLLECLVVGKAVGHKGGHVVREADPHGEGPVVIYQRQVVAVVGGDETAAFSGCFFRRGLRLSVGSFRSGRRLSIILGRISGRSGRCGIRCRFCGSRRRTGRTSAAAGT